MADSSQIEQVSAPTVSRGTITTQTDTTNIKLDISEVIDFLSPFDTPLLDMVGRDSLHSPATQLKHEWLSDKLTPREGTLRAAYTSGDYVLKLTSGQGKYVLPGQLIHVGDTVYRITGGAPDSDDLTVDLIRGVNDADEDHASGDVWRRISSAEQEGGVARNDGPKTHLDKPFNYTQILKDWIVVTGSMEVIDRYGYANERSYQEEKTLRKLAIDLEYTLLYGVRSWDGGPPRISTMGGLYEFVYMAGRENSWNTVEDLSGDNITETKLQTHLQRLWELGGEPDFILVNGTNKRIMKDWMTPYIRTERSERTAGAAIGQYESDFGMVDILLNRWMRPDDIIIGSRGMLGIGPLNGRQFTSRLLPSTIDGTWYEILGEYTMEVHKPELAFAWLYNTGLTV